MMRHQAHCAQCFHAVLGLRGLAFAWDWYTLKALSSPEMYRADCADAGR